MSPDFLRLIGLFPHAPIFAACSIALAAIIAAVMMKANKRWAALASAAVIATVGVFPLFAARYVKSRALYQIHLEVLRPDQSAADIAQVKSSQGEMQMVPGGWELDIPLKDRPVDGKVTFSASVKDEFLVGQASLDLSDDFYPTATVHLAPITSAMLRGVVVDENMRAVAGAKVSVEGSAQAALTDRQGNFVVAAHAGNGQFVEVNANKGGASGHARVKAGKTIEIILAEK